MFTPLACSTPIGDICLRAQSYGIPGIMVDGNDVLAVNEAAEAAVDRARAGDGPTIVECKTYRHMGHYQGDTQRYRDPSEVEQWKKLDPIPRFKQQLLDNGIMTEAMDREILAQLKQEADEAVEFAVNSPEPDLSTLTKDVYVPFKPV
jgi:pyruvate dehydrogenase E1 component alpha subunit